MDERPIVRVESCWDEPSFDSFDKAVQATERLPRAEQAKRDTELVEGAAIVDALVQPESLQLRLSDGQSLRFYVDGKRVAWEIQPPGSAEEGVPFESSMDLHLQYRDKIIPWDRKEFLRRMQGKRVKLVSASFVFAFLYVEKLDGIMFNRLINLGDGPDLLQYGFE